MKNNFSFTEVFVGVAFLIGEILRVRRGVENRNLRSQAILDQRSTKAKMFHLNLQGQSTNSQSLIIFIDQGFTSNRRIVQLY